MTRTGLEPEPDELRMPDDRVLVRLLDALPDPVVVLNGRGVLQWANHRAEEVFGGTLTEAIGANGLDLVHPDDVELALVSLTSIQDKRVGTPIEIRLRTARGWRLMELIGSPLTWLPDGAVLLTFRDLTARRRYEIAHNHDARLRSLVDNSAAITMLISPDGCIQSASGALTRILGQDPELVEGLPLTELVGIEDRAVVAHAFERASRGASVAGPVKVQTSLACHGNLTSIPFEMAIVNLIDDPTVGGYVVTAHDITDQQLADQRLRRALSLLQATLDATADGIFVVDNDGTIVSYNQRLIEMWGVSESLLRSGIRRKVSDFVSTQLVDPEGYRTRVESVYQDRESDSSDILEFKDGRVFERLSRPQRVDGEIVGRVWSFRDITERVRLEERLTYQAFHDPLTGLANRALFRDRLAHSAARAARSGSSVGVVVVDLDELNVINDTFGHDAGDAVLQAAADSITACLRGGDSVARLGGDEFAVLVEGADTVDDALALAARVLEAVRRPVEVAGRRIRVTASIGVALAAPPAHADRLLCHAGLATFAAKDLGGDRVARFTPRMHTGAARAGPHT